VLNGREDLGLLPQTLDFWLFYVGFRNYLS
jgi:hypothetical protein